MTRIAMLGLGAMGSRMAERLLKAGQEVTVYNRTAERAADLAAMGATVAATPRQAAEGVDIVIGMVADDEASAAVWTDPDTGAVAALGPQSVAIESSTVTPAWVERLSAMVAERGAAFLDAPVVGSRPQASAGQLIYLVGGDADTVFRASPTLALMGAAVHHVGPVSHGATLKLVVNTLFGIQVAALGELIGFLAGAGVDRARALEVLSEIPVLSPAAKGVAGLITARNFAPMFPIDLVAKDFRYAGAAASAAGADLPVADATGRVFERARQQGFGGDNIAGVAKLYIGNEA